MVGKRLIGGEQITIRKRPRKEESGVNDIFLTIDWALSNSSLVGDLSIDTTVAGTNQKKGQKGKSTKSKAKEIPPFFPRSIYPLLGQEMDVLYSVSPAKDDPISRSGTEVWVSGYRVLDPLLRNTKYSEGVKNQIIRGFIPLVHAREAEIDWDGRLLVLPPHLVRVHQNDAKEFQSVFGVLNL